MKTKIDMTINDRAKIAVLWKDGNGVEREIEIQFASGFQHGLLCVSAANESLAYLTAKGTVNKIGEAPYAKNL